MVIDNSFVFNSLSHNVSCSLSLGCVHINMNWFLMILFLWSGHQVEKEWKTVCQSTIVYSFDMAGDHKYHKFDYGYAECMATLPDCFSSPSPGHWAIATGPPQMRYGQVCSYDKLPKFQLGFYETYPKVKVSECQRIGLGDDAKLVCEQ